METQWTTVTNAVVQYSLSKLTTFNKHSRRTQHVVDVVVVVIVGPTHRQPGQVHNNHPPGRPHLCQCHPPHATMVRNRTDHPSRKVHQCKPTRATRTRQLAFPNPRQRTHGSSPQPTTAITARQHPTHGCGVRPPATSSSAAPSPSRAGFAHCPQRLLRASPHNPARRDLHTTPCERLADEAWPTTHHTTLARLTPHNRGGAHSSAVRPQVSCRALNFARQQS